MRSAVLLLGLLALMWSVWVGIAESRSGDLALVTPPEPVVLRAFETAQVTDLPSLTPFAAARAERLLRERMACLGCHRLDGDGGQIGPTLDGVGARLGADRVLAMILDPVGTLPGTRMPPQPMRSSDARRLAAYLVSHEPRPPVAAAPATQPVAPPAERSDGSAPDGAHLYARHCAACHGESGGGDGWNAPNLPVAPTAHADAGVMSRRPDDSLYDAIHAGAFVLDGSPRMPAFGGLLTDEQIRALVTHIRALCECTAPAWSTDGRAGR